MNSEVPVSQQVRKVIRQFPQKQPVADNAGQAKPRLSMDVLAGVSVILLTFSFILNIWSSRLSLPMILFAGIWWFLVYIQKSSYAVECQVEECYDILLKLIVNFGFFVFFLLINTLPHEDYLEREEQSYF